MNCSRSAGNLRHPVFLVPPWSFRAEHAPIGRAGTAGFALVDAREDLLAPSFRRQLADAGACTTVTAPSERRRSSNPRANYRAGFGHVRRAAGSRSRLDVEFIGQAQQEIARVDRRAISASDTRRSILRINGIVHASLDQHDLLA